MSHGGALCNACTSVMVGFYVKEHLAMRDYEPNGSY